MSPLSRRQSARSASTPATLRASDTPRRTTRRTIRQARRCRPESRHRPVRRDAATPLSGLHLPRGCHGRQGRDSARSRLPDRRVPRLLSPYPRAPATHDRGRIGVQKGGGLRHGDVKVRVQTPRRSHFARLSPQDQRPPASDVGRILSRSVAPASPCTPSAPHGIPRCAAGARTAALLHESGPALPLFHS